MANTPSVALLLFTCIIPFEHLVMLQLTQGHVHVHVHVGHDLLLNTKTTKLCSVVVKLKVK